MNWAVQVEGCGRCVLPSVTACMYGKTTTVWVVVLTAAISEGQANSDLFSCRAVALCVAQAAVDM